MNKKLLYSLPLLILLIGCTPKKNKESNNTDSNQEETSTSQSSGNTKTFTFLGSNTREGFTPASAIEGSDSSKKGDIALTNMLDGFISSYTAETIFFQPVGDTSDTSLTFGSAKHTGSMTFNFAKQVTSIKVNVRNFMKYNETTSEMNIDKIAKFNVGDNSINLTLTDPSFVPSIEEEFSFETPITSITMTNYNNEGNSGRVALNSLTITYL